METENRWRVWSRATATAALVALFAAPAFADTLDDPYRSDPLGLIAHYDLTSELAAGSGGYEVWICDPGGGATKSDGETVNAAADALTSLVQPYWAAVSGGAYQVFFEPGGVIPAGHSRGCVTAAAELSAGQQDAALVFHRTAYQTVGFSGWGTPGSWCYDRTRYWWCQTAFPANSRYALVQMSVGWGMFLSATVHEMGHTLGMPHSFTGLLPSGHPAREYDNPMDVVSGGGQFVAALGTVAVNRYAAGWIDPSSVRLFEGGTERVVLDSDPRSDSVQMLVVPSDTEGVWLALNARTVSVFDQVPEEGVEAYVIDQTPGACGQTDGVCWGATRRTIPYPTSNTDPLAHVFQPGGQFTWNGRTVTVDSRSGETFTVTITDGTVRDRFVDDDGSSHEAAINLVAALGITRGCATNPPMFCPDQPVTRAEMAAFVLRALGAGDPAPARTFTFGDVPAGKWYVDYVHAFAETGIDEGRDGLWRPEEPLTRLEMAQWLTAAFGHITPADPIGIFADIGEQHWTTVEGLYRAGITRGCSTTPLMYCPDQPVTRAQMASFLTRTVNTQPN